MADDSISNALCEHCGSVDDCECPTNPVTCRSGACPCGSSCPCRVSSPPDQAQTGQPSPLGCVVPFFLPWLLWLFWFVMFVVLVVQAPPIWIWVIFLLPPLFVVFRKIVPPTNNSTEGPPITPGGSVPPWSGCVWFPVIVLLPIVMLIAILVVLGQDDDEPTESTTNDGDRTEQPDTTGRTDEDDAAPPPADLVDDDPVEAVSSTVPPATPATAETVPEPVPAETTTTLAPEPSTTVFVGTPLVPGAVAILDEECATSSVDFTMENFNDDVAITMGPAEGGSPPLEASPPLAIEIEYVGAATGDCGNGRRLIVVADLGGPADAIQTSLAIDFPSSVAGDDGYVADPNGVGGIGQTGGWDQLFPVSDGNLSEFDDNFESLDIGVRYQIRGDVIAWSVPIPPDLGDVNYIVQTFFRNGVSEASPIVWSTATGAHVFDE